MISIISRGVTTKDFTGKMFQVSSHKVGAFRFAGVHDYLIKNSIFQVGQFFLDWLRINKNSAFYDSLQKNIYCIFRKMKFWSV